MTAATATAEARVLTEVRALAPFASDPRLYFAAVALPCANDSDRAAARGVLLAAIFALLPGLANDGKLQDVVQKIGSGIQVPPDVAEQIAQALVLSGLIECSLWGTFLRSPPPDAPPDAPPVPDAGYVSTRAAAARLDVDVNTVRRWVREGRLPASRLGGPRGRLRIFVEDLALAMATSRMVTRARQVRP